MKMTCLQSDGSMKEIESKDNVFDLTQPERSKREDSEGARESDFYQPSEAYMDVALKIMCGPV